MFYYRRMFSACDFALHFFFFFRFPLPACNSVLWRRRWSGLSWEPTDDFVDQSTNFKLFVLPKVKYRLWYLTPRPRLVFVVSGLVCVCVQPWGRSVRWVAVCVCVCAPVLFFFSFFSFFSSVFVATRPGRRFQWRADRFFSCCKIVCFLSRHKHGKCNAYLNFLMTSEFITTLCKVSLHVRSLSCRAVADFLHSLFFFPPHPWIFSLRRRHRVHCCLGSKVTWGVLSCHRCHQFAVSLLCVQSDRSVNANAAKTSRSPVNVITVRHRGSPHSSRVFLWLHPLHST